MDLTFNCPNCKQELAADSTLSGSEIACPSCNHTIVIPDSDPALALRGVHNAIASSAAAKEEYHFSVPVHDSPTEYLIQKPQAPLEVAAVLESDKHLRIRCIKRTDCVEVGRDRFEEIVTEFLGKIGETNLVSITPLNYTHLDIGSQKLLTDFGVMILYRG